MMVKLDIEQIAQKLYDAEKQRTEVVRITEQYPDLSVEEAYYIQEKLVGLKRRNKVEIIGPKMGLTSKAKMKQMNVEEPIYGYILEDMVYPNHATLSMSEFIHPKVEAEIAFVLGEDIEGPNVTASQVLAKTKHVVGALEIIDSRYKDFRFTLPDVIADNASSSKVVLGTYMVSPEKLKLDLVEVVLKINGETVEQGAGKAVLDHPANSVAFLANMLAKRGEKLKAGEVILTGGVTGAVMLKPGDHVSASLEGLGEVSFTILD
jgi:2-oxo-3-hexenedioate decarboxylase